VLFRPSGGAGFLRFSPDGKHLAFANYFDKLSSDGSSRVTVLDRAGKATPIGGRWDISGLAWSASGKEILFIGLRKGEPLALRAITLDGRERVVARIPGDAVVHDVSAGGRVLLSRESETGEMKFLGSGETQERDLSWLDHSLPSELSRDGTQALFEDCGAAGGVPFSVCSTYLRRTDGSPAVRLGEGWPINWSPDGRWVMLGGVDPMMMVPVGPGSPKPIAPIGTIENLGWIDWTADGRRQVFAGRLPGHAARLWIQDLPDGVPHPITDEAEGAQVDEHVRARFSPDGQRLALGLGQGVRIVSVDGGATIEPPGLAHDESLLGWSIDGTSLFVNGPVLDLPIPMRLHIDLVEVATGRRQRLRELVPVDPTGVLFTYVAGSAVTRDGQSYLYGLLRRISEMYVVEGLALE
jgi:dipeptidyl aminopeptidase/acylaminoacyl peptidase